MTDLTDIVILKGEPAFSDFRLKKLTEALRERDIQCRQISSHFIYVVKHEAQTSLSQSQLDKLATLLKAQRLTNLPETQQTPNHWQLIVSPRVGTISPWSTKATDILHHCDLQAASRVERAIYWQIDLENSCDFQDVSSKLHYTIYDPMLESLLLDFAQVSQLFVQSNPQPLEQIDLINGGMQALNEANAKFGFALSDEEKVYLVEQFQRLGRNPTDVELMMFAQVNSEHCRHKIFNASWTIDGDTMPQSLFNMIRHTHQNQPEGTITAYSDNAAVIQGHAVKRFYANPESKDYLQQDDLAHISIKVETHNHPTAISPYPGAATGSGGEIRDEGATGRGGAPKAGLVGFSVSNLRLPALRQPWEIAESKPSRIASPLQIMLEGPIGAAAFNNEFGRPNISGYFRTYEHLNDADETMRYGYHKPIMLAGGIGSVQNKDIKKLDIPEGTPIVVLGGPTMLIGLGGGAASSVASGQSDEKLDFASVQRGNPEMQRRCQEVINNCCHLEDNPILSIHDVGAGGLCNAMPELVHDAGMGAKFELRHVLNDEPGMSPMQIWCNESQERYVLAIDKDKLAQFEAICARERCLYAVVGYADDAQNLLLTDAYFANSDDKSSTPPIDLPMEVLFGLPPKMHRHATTIKKSAKALEINDDLNQAAMRILSCPTVADKTFLITIGDRSVTGLVSRDQMVGKWQVPVADVAVTCADYYGVAGEAMALGERTPLAINNAPASGRMAIAEAITNLIAAPVQSLKDIKLSANWMVAAGEPGYDADLYATVKAVALEMCPAMGLSIPVGKDSMSMQTVWNKDHQQQKCVAPMSLVISAFAPINDVRDTVTPVLDENYSQTELWLIDIGRDQNRLAGSVLSQVYAQYGDTTPDVDHVQDMVNLFNFIQALRVESLLLSYHDRSDGGVLTTLCEMAFASRCGLDINIQSKSNDALAVYANEEIGVVIQTPKTAHESITALIEKYQLTECAQVIGQPNDSQNVQFKLNNQVVLEKSRAELQKTWSQTSWQMQRMRDNPDCADSEYARIDDVEDTGLFAELTYNPTERVAKSFAIQKTQPKVAILREQGVNGHIEMAAAFSQAGFQAVDVTMSDLAAGMNLQDFHGAVACGGFSFGDVLGAGAGWGKSILFNEQIKNVFGDFFARDNTFALGVCNGCQMFSVIKELIPGAENWPAFMRNVSEQYEARYVMSEITSDLPIFFQDMQGSRLPIVVAHGEGQAVFDNQQDYASLDQGRQVCLRYIDNTGEATMRYPYNPNGSYQSSTAFCSADGRVMAMMPHPERIFRTLNCSWRDNEWGEYSPWMRMFENARRWLG